MERIQRKRTKEWRMPENTLYVGRPSKWSNPFMLVDDAIYIHVGYRRKGLGPWVFYNLGDIEDVVYLYGKLLDGTEFVNHDCQYWSNHFKKLNLDELRKYDALACWCPIGTPCHIDVLIELLNKQS